MRYLLALSVFAIFINCSETKWNVDLGDGYQYLFEGGAMDVDVYSGDAITYNSLFDDPIVFPKIVDYKFNSEFIVCKQEFDKELCSELLQSSLEFNYKGLTIQKNEIKYKALLNYIPELVVDNTLKDILSSIEQKNVLGFSKPVADSIINGNPSFIKMAKQKVNYYIIDKTNKKRYLILDKSGFASRFKSLNIPDSLSLD